MNTYRAIHDGLNRFSNLIRRDQDWVRARLLSSVLPQEAVAASRVFASVAPRRRPVSVFLSHNSADKPFVRGVYRYLSKMGLRVWLDEAELDAGDSLIQALADAVFRVDCVVAVVSSSSVSSKWVKKELAWAMTREIKGRRVRVIPIKKDETDLPRTIADKIYLDFSTPYRRSKNRDTLLATILNQRAKRA